MPIQYGSMRSSTTGSKAVRGDKTRDLPQFRGIGSIPNVGKLVAQRPQMDLIPPEPSPMPAAPPMVPPAWTTLRGSQMELDNGPYIQPSPRMQQQEQMRQMAPQDFAPALMAPPPQYMPPMPQYMPQYARPRVPNGETDIYELLQQQAIRGVNNKRAMDTMRQEDWRRDRAVRGWDELAGGVLSPLASMFVQDKAARARMLSGGQDQMYRSDRMRQLRNSERGQQFGEDKYYTDLNFANDPNSFENWATQQGIQTNRMNAFTGAQNSVNQQMYREGLLDARERNAQIQEQRLMQQGQQFDRREGRYAQNDEWKKDQGQQGLNIRNKQVAQGDTRLELQRQQIQQQIAKSQAEMAHAIDTNDIKRAQLAQEKLKMLTSLYAVDPESGNSKFAPEAFAAVGAKPPVRPTKKQEKKPGLFDGLVPKPKAEPAKASPMAMGKAKPKLTKEQVQKLLAERGLI